MPRGGYRPNSGRKPGGKNKKAEELLSLIQSHPLTTNFDPLVSLAVFANGQIIETHEAFRQIADLLLQKPPKTKQALAIAQRMHSYPVIGRDCMITAAKECAQYVYPKMRSIEIADPDGDNPFAQLAELMAQAAKS